MDRAWDRNLYNVRSTRSVHLTCLFEWIHHTTADGILARIDTSMYIGLCRLLMGCAAMAMLVSRHVSSLGGQALAGECIMLRPTHHYNATRINPLLDAYIAILCTGTHRHRRLNVMAALDSACRVYLVYLFGSRLGDDKNLLFGGSTSLTRMCRFMAQPVGSGGREPNMPIKAGSRGALVWALVQGPCLQKMSVLRCV